MMLAGGSRWGLQSEITRRLGVDRATIIGCHSSEPPSVPQAVSSTFSTSHGLTISTINCVTARGVNYSPALPNDECRDLSCGIFFRKSAKFLCGLY